MCAKYFPEASILKIGMSYPLPMEKIRAFAATVEKLIVIEELDPFIEDQIKAAGITVAHGKDVFPVCGEFTTAKVRAAAVQAGLLPSADESILVVSGRTRPDCYPGTPSGTLSRMPPSCILLRVVAQQTENLNRRGYWMLYYGRSRAL